MQLRQQIFIFIITVVPLLFAGTTFGLAQEIESKSIVPAPSIDCITTDAADGLTINWTPPNDFDNSFVRYEVYELNAGLLSSINTLASNSFSPALLATQEYSFYIAVVSDDNGQQEISYGDTVSNIFLELTNPTNGTALLDWNAPKNPIDANYNDYFHIYREFPLGNWSLIDSVPYIQSNFIDTIDICSAFLNYRIELPTSTCAFTSNVEGDNFSDDIVPDIPDIDYVSYNELTDSYDISWNQNGQDDTYGYIIYLQDASGAYVEIDTVYGINNTDFSHSPTGNGPYSYTVAAFDSCYTVSTPITHQTSAKGDPHKTVWLTGATSNCSQDAELNWSAYQGFGPNVIYTVRYREVGQAWQTATTTDLLTATFSRIPGIDYEFQIIANVSGVQANSNIVEVLWAGATGPSFSFLSHVTVVNENIEVMHKVSLDGGIARVVLQKFNPLNADFEDIQEKPVQNGEVYFVDEDVAVNDEVYYYRTVIVDSCDNRYPASNLGQNMVMTGNIDPISLMVELQWSEYEEFIGSTITYDIYRAIDGVVDDFPIANIGANNRFFTDNLKNVLADDFTGKVCYYAKAREGVNGISDADSSASNLACLLLEPLVYIPNAFTVNGANPVFYPVTSYHDLQDYEFAVYNRFGQIVFQTNERFEGWDGYLSDGSVAREGVYVYRLSLRDGNGIEVLRHGHVTLLNNSQ